MKFHELTSLFDFYKKLNSEKISARHWYEQEIAKTIKRLVATNLYDRASVIAYIQMLCELDWEKSDRPYYKIHPNLLPYFVETKLNVPSEFFKLPFPSFLIRLPEEHSVDCLRIDEKHYVKTILVGGKKEGSLSIVAGGEEPSVSTDRQFVMFLDTNETETMGLLEIPILTYNQLIFKDDKQTAEEALNTVMGKCNSVSGSFIDDGGILIPTKVVEACLRITMAVTFLATGGDKIVECDVLSRDLEKYLESKKLQDKKTQTLIEERAKRNKKHGFLIGREVSLPRKKSNSDSSSDSNSSLEYQHQRSAHWHWVRYGEKKALMKLVFYGQQTVRPDLPINPNAIKGYRT